MQEYSYSYTKHIYAGTQRIASKVGDIESFGADPRRMEYAGADLKEIDFGAKYKQQSSALFARYDSLGVEHRPNTLNDYVGGQSFCRGEKEFEPSQTGKDEFETPDYEHLIFFYHPDHLGSTSLVTDNSGNVVQSVAYIPYGEVFIEERNGTWNTPYLFNGKELDEETGLYYYGARYLNPTNGMWLSVDPLFEKYVGMSPYNYCLGNPVKLVDVDGRESGESESAKTNLINATSLELSLIKEDAYMCNKIADGSNEVIYQSKKMVAETNNKVQNLINNNKTNSSQKVVSSNSVNTMKQNVVRPENVSKFASKANYTLSFVCLGVKVIDNIEKGSMDSNDYYDYASWGVATFGGIRGATASFFTELYRQAGEWFIEKVQDFNSFFDRNKVDIFGNMYYTGSPF